MYTYNTIRMCIEYAQTIEETILGGALLDSSTPAAFHALVCINRHIIHVWCVNRHAMRACVYVSSHVMCV